MISPRGRLLQRLRTDRSFPRAWTRAALFLLPVVVLALGALIVVFRSRLLPDRFVSDSEYIQRLATVAGDTALHSKSYGNVALLYRILGLGNSELLVGILSYAFAVFAVYTALRARSYRPTLLGMLAASIALLGAAVYLSTFAKDVFVLGVTLVVLKVRAGLFGDVLVLASVLLYADIFRTYWYLVAALYVVFRMLTIVDRSGWALVVAPIVALIAIAVAAQVVLGVGSDSARAAVNGARMGSPNASTMIVPFVDLPAPWGSMVNTVLTLLTIIVPVPLVLKASPYYLASALAFIVLWVCCGSGVVRGALRDVRGKRSVAILLAMLTTQALFEPDYGSVLRHLTPLLPLIVYVALQPVQSLGGVERLATSFPPASRAAGADVA